MEAEAAGWSALTMLIYYQAAYWLGTRSAGVTTITRAAALCALGFDLEPQPRHTRGQDERVTLGMLVVPSMSLRMILGAQFMVETRYGQAHKSQV